MSAYFLVGFGGALGAMTRYAFGVWAGRIFGPVLPVSTLLINVSGSLVMGIVIGMLARVVPAGSEEIRLFAAVGILGGFTTFSAFSLDTITLIERGELIAALCYVLLSVVLSVLALYLGLLVTRWGTV